MKTLQSLELFLAASLLLALGGCGTNGGTNQACPGGAANSNSGGLEVLYGAPLSDVLNTSVAAIIDPSTGAFTSGFFNPVPFFCSGGITVVDSQFLYISVPRTMCFGGEAAIYGYFLDPSTGAPNSLQGSPFSTGVGNSPGGMAAVPNSLVLYVADAGKIDAFTVDASNGLLTPISGSPFTSGSNSQLVVDPSGKFLYASDDDPPGSILAFTIDPEGALTPVTGSPFLIPGQRGSNSQPYGIVDSGKFVYAALNGSNQVAAFSIDNGTGALTPIPGAPFPTGGNPVALTLANDYLYVVDGEDSSVSGYSVSPTGALTAVAGSPFLKNSSATTLAVDLSGKYLYVSTTATLDGYNIDPSTGTLCPGLASVQNDGPLWLTVAQLP